MLTKHKENTGNAHNVNSLILRIKDIAIFATNLSGDCQLLPGGGGGGVVSIL